MQINRNTIVLSVGRSVQVNVFFFLHVSRIFAVSSASSAPRQHRRLNGVREDFFSMRRRRHEFQHQQARPRIFCPLNFVRAHGDRQWGDRPQPEPKSMRSSSSSVFLSRWSFVSLSILLFILWFSFAVHKCGRRYMCLMRSLEPFFNKNNHIKCHHLLQNHLEDHFDSLIWRFCWVCLCGFFLCCFVRSCLRVSSRLQKCVNGIY